MTEIARYKYEPLELYLKNLPASQDELALSFEEVENIIRQPLPPSAYKHRPWWANQTNISNRSQAAAWMKTDFRVYDVRQEQTSSAVIFIRAKLARHNTKLVKIDKVVKNDEVIEFFGKEVVEKLNEHELKDVKWALAIFSEAEEKKEYLGPAFSPIFRRLDRVAVRFISDFLFKKCPDNQKKKAAWFAPKLPSLQKNQQRRYDMILHSLRKGKDDYAKFGSPLARLRDCLYYALHDHHNFDGVFRALKEEFNFSGANELLKKINPVCEYRNDVVHNLGKPLEQKKARKALKEWVETLALISVCYKNWYSRLDLNEGPPDPQSGALTY